MISIHALREEGDLVILDDILPKAISIHALREEGDGGGPLQRPSFQISIHALREEGDLLVLRLFCVLSYFYPRPPRGGRLHTA